MFSFEAVQMLNFPRAFGMYVALTANQFASRLFAQLLKVWRYEWRVRAASVLTAGRSALVFKTDIATCLIPVAVTKLLILKLPSSVFELPSSFS